MWCETYQKIYLDDFIAWELELRNVGSIASHEIAVQHPENGLVSYNEQIVVLPFEFENDGFEANGKVMVGLYLC
jgi:hypothetical protein